MRRGVVLAAGDYANAPALIAHDSVVSWGELDARVDSVAAGLRALDLSRTDRVALALPNGRPQGGEPGQRPTFDAKTQKAFSACRQYLPSRPQGGFDGGQGFNGPSA